MNNPSEITGNEVNCFRREKEKVCRAQKIFIKTHIQTGFLLTLNE